MKNMPRVIMAAIIMAFVLISPAKAQSSMTRDEAKTAAILEILKEKKDKEERAQVDAEKRKLMGENPSDGNGFVWVVGIAFILVIIKVVFFSRGSVLSRGEKKMRDLYKIRNGDSEKVRKWKVERLGSLEDSMGFMHSSENTLSAFELIAINKKFYADEQRDLARLKE